MVGAVVDGTRSAFTTHYVMDALESYFGVLQRPGIHVLPLPLIGRTVRASVHVGHLTVCGGLMSRSFWPPELVLR